MRSHSFLSEAAFTFSSVAKLALWDRSTRAFTPHCDLCKPMTLPWFFRGSSWQHHTWAAVLETFWPSCLDTTTRPLYRASPLFLILTQQLWDLTVHLLPDITPPDRYHCNQLSNGTYFTCQWFIKMADQWTVQVEIEIFMFSKLRIKFGFKTIECW